MLAAIFLDGVVMETTKDISIGKDKWIGWIDFDSTNASDLFEIDDLLWPTFDFWDKLETQCVTGCCGIDAYSFWEEDIKLAVDKIDKAALIKNLLAAKAEIESTSETIVTSEKLNNLIDKSVFIQLLDHIVTTIQLENKRIESC
jgi:hypothetical protein